MPASVYHGLAAVAPLRRGRTELAEGKGVGPVKRSHVKAVLNRVGTVVSAMIRLQQTSGMRLQDVARFGW